MDLKIVPPTRLQEYCYRYEKRWGYQPSVIHLAKVADTQIVPNYRKNDLLKICKKMNWQIKTRKEITDYQRRKCPAIRIGKYTYYLTPSVDMGK